jgi:hypothetical protein
VPKPENPGGPTSIKVDNIPSDVRRKMWLLKRVNMIMGGPTEYKKMVIEALDYYVNKDPKNVEKLRMAEEMLKQSGQEEAGGGER